MLQPLLRRSGGHLAARAARRGYATASSKARLNLPTDYGKTPLLYHSSKAALAMPGLSDAAKNGDTTRINYYTAVNQAMAHALKTDPRVIVFGEDVAFGGVFRCTMGLQTEYGDDRVFNTPLSEQGIVAFAIGASLEGMRPVAEIQFADYVFPAFDQIVNEAAKIRYRYGSNGVEGEMMNVSGLVLRMPTGGVSDTSEGDVACVD